MNNNIATTIDAAMKRAAREVSRSIAKEGVVALKNILDDSGFAQSEYLNDYDVYAHIRGNQVTFEIIVAFDSVQAQDDATQKAMEQSTEKLQEVEQTYGVRSNRAYSYVRDHRKPAKDARQPAKDARQPAKDARKTSTERLIGHEIALHAPRSARITQQGKLSVTLKRSIRQSATEVHLPQGDFEGLMKKIMDKLETIIVENFIPKIQDIIQDYVG
jgi:hypothetical protein